MSLVALYLYLQRAHECERSGCYLHCTDCTTHTSAVQILELLRLGPTRPSRTRGEGTRGYGVWIRVMVNVLRASQPCTVSLIRNAVPCKEVLSLSLASGSGSWRRAAC